MPITIMDRVLGWLADIRRRASLAGRRIRARVAWLGVVALASLILLLLGEIRGGLGLAALMIALAWCAAWPLSDETGQAQTLSAHSPEDSADALWRTMLDGIPNAALVLDGDQTVLAANRAAMDLLSVRAGFYVGQTSRAPELLAAVNRAVETNQPQPFHFEARREIEQRIDGLATPLAAKAGRSGQPALLLVFTDQSEVERLAQMRADFVANASHELRTPLASLRGFIDTLQGAAKDDPAARRRFLGIMSEQATRMSRLIDDLLELSRIEMRVHLRPHALVDLGRVVSEAVKDLEPLAAAAGVTVAWSPPTPATVRGDRDELVQAAQNLLQNAIKYGRAGGHVEVSVTHETKGSHVSSYHLTVADDGPGIAREHLPRLTERFYRVNAGASRAKGGTGLGLAIVKHVALRHDGDLSIVSEPGEGSRFTLRLPSARPTY